MAMCMGVAGGVYAADGGETVVMADGSEQLAKASEQATACQKAVDEVNEALEKDQLSRAEQLKKKKDAICNHKYTAEKEKLEEEDAQTEEEANDQAAAAEEKAAGSTANFGGAANSEAKVTTEMPESMSQENTLDTATGAEQAAAAEKANAVAAEAEKASDAEIKIDGVAQAPEAQTTTVTAADMIKNGKIPESAADRAKLALQYAREKGMNEEEAQALMQTIYRENRGLNPALCNPKSSACGIGQYINSTWNSNCSQFGSRGSFQAQMDCLINDVSKRYDNYTSGKQTCGGVSFDACNYIQHYAGSYSQKAMQLGYVNDAINVLRRTGADSAKFFANAAGALGGDVSSILASMKTLQETGLGGTIAQTLGFTGGNNGATTTQGLVSQFLGMNNGLTNTTAGSNTIAGGLQSLLSGLFGGGGSSGSSSGTGTADSGTGTTAAGTTRTLVSSETTVHADGSIKTVQIYSDGLKLTSQTAATAGGATTSAAANLKSLCGGVNTTSSDAFMLMVDRCVAALKS